tara:strand:+ start:13 stop:222 length:210 start_codon:yes stop_codon:yes gene_type:complete
MKDLIIILLLVLLVILTGIIDTTLSLQDKKHVEDWTIEELYNPTGEWCFLDQEHPLPVDCQFNFDWETD